MRLVGGSRFVRWIAALSLWTRRPPALGFKQVDVVEVSRCCGPAPRGWSCGRARDEVGWKTARRYRVVRSTRVPIADLFKPMIRSPSGHNPGIDLGGAVADQDVLVTNFLPRPRVRACGTHNARPVRRHADSSRFNAPRPCVRLWT